MYEFQAVVGNLNFILFSLSLSVLFAAQSEGRPCEYNSRIYQNGESFQPNCKHQCTCIDGAVGCIPLCPQELSLPNLGCPNPRLVKVTGQCCEEWVCDEDGAKDPADDRDGLLGKGLAFDASEVELTRNNELIAVGKGGSLKRLPGKLRLSLKDLVLKYIPSLKLCRNDSLSLLVSLCL